MMGKSGSAVSDGPSTATKLFSLVSIFVTKGTESAGSVVLSTATHLTLCPRTPPAAFTTRAPAKQPDKSPGPSAALEPVNGSKTAKVKLPLDALWVEAPA